jgi:hypothetical protein
MGDDERLTVGLTWGVGLVLRLDGRFDVRLNAPAAAKKIPHAFGCVGFFCLMTWGMPGFSPNLWR